MAAIASLQFFPINCDQYRYAKKFAYLSNNISFSIWNCSFAQPYYTIYKSY